MALALSPVFHDVMSLASSAEPGELYSAPYTSREVRRAA
jgi:hypothetical protein